MKRTTAGQADEDMRSEVAIAFSSRYCRSERSDRSERPPCRVSHRVDAGHGRQGSQGYG